MGKPSSRILVVVLGALAASCASHSRQVATTTPPPARAAAAATDPTDELIRSAEAHFQAGIAEDQAGHLTRAREEFDRALDIYLTAPGGAYSSPRLAESYR